MAYLGSAWTVFGVACFGVARFGLAWLGSDRLGFVWFGSVRFHSAWIVVCVVCFCGWLCGATTRPKTTCHGTCAWCGIHGGRFERTHGDVSDGHTKWRRCHRQFCSPNVAHIDLSRFDHRTFDTHKKPRNQTTFLCLRNTVEHDKKHDQTTGRLFSNEPAD